MSSDAKGEDQVDVQIGSDLLQMARGEIRAVVGVEAAWDTAHGPAL